MNAVCVSWNSFDVSWNSDAMRRALRVVLVAFVLTVGSLSVTMCPAGGDDVEQAARDQYDRMHGIVLVVTE